MRLPHCVYYAALVPISLFWYGWSTQEKVHWYVDSFSSGRVTESMCSRANHFPSRSCPIIGLLFFGIGIIGVFIPVVTYLVDAFTPYAASAVAANRTAMSIMGAFLPLAGAPLYKALDYGVGNTVLAVIALVMTPLPVIFYRHVISVLSFPHFDTYFFFSSLLSSCP